MELVNIVATVKLTLPLDFLKIIKSIKGTESASTWLKMRLQPEGYYIAFYRSGKFLITGVTSFKIIEEIAERVIKILNDSGIDATLKEIIIQNLVLKDDVGTNVKLEDVIYSLDPVKASYEPEQFPGLIYKDWNANFLLFPSGKMVITGVKTKEHAEYAALELKKLINLYI